MALIPQSAKAAQLGDHPDFTPELSCRVCIFIPLEFEARFGRVALDQIFKELNTPLNFEYFKDLSNYVSLDFMQRILDRVIEIAGEDSEIYQSSALRTASVENLGFVFYLLRAFGSPEQMYKNLPRFGSDYNRVGKQTVPVATPGHAIVRYESFVREKNKHFCSGRIWQYASLTQVWGIKSECRELECQLDGSPACLYEITWQPKPNLSLLRSAVFSGLATGLALTTFLILGAGPFALLAIAVFFGPLVFAASHYRSISLSQTEELKEQAESKIEALRELNVRFNEIQELNRNLELKVRERTQELTAAQGKLRESLNKALELDRLKTSFFSNISHEFRTPLTLILGPIHELIEVTRAKGDLQLTRPAQMVLRNAYRLLDLVNQLLDIVQLEAGRMTAHLEPTDLAALTHDLASQFRSAAERVGLQFQVESDSSIGTVLIDRRMWERIIFNLVSNALKFTHVGRIYVSLKANPSINQIYLQVKDTGMGMPSDELGKVFNRFYRASNSDTRRSEGSGIGLALVHELSSLLGGAVYCSSELGTGSTFQVQIPIQRPSLSVRDETSFESKLGPQQFSSLHFDEKAHFFNESSELTQQYVGKSNLESKPAILIVEDNQDMRHYLMELLKVQYHVRTAENAAQAYSEMIDHTPDLVISDVMMPGEDGITLLKKVRQNEKLKTIPFLLLSARAGEFVLSEGLEAGADDYIVKPFSAREFLARVQSNLELFYGRRAAEQYRMKETFIGVAAHELRTPITSLKFNLALMQRKLKQTSAEPQLAKVFESFSSSVSRLEKLSEDLLSLSSIQGNAFELKTSPVDIISFSKEIVDELQKQFERSIDVEFSTPSLTAQIDPDRFKQVLVNLISNAVKYSPATGRVVLKIDKSIDKANDEQAVITVQDEGPGIPQDRQQFLFDKYYRVPGIKIQTGSQVGLGLGLYVAKEIVERHGGKVSVKSEPGAGSAFTASIPIKF